MSDPGYWGHINTQNRQLGAVSLPRASWPRLPARPPTDRSVPLAGPAPSAARSHQLVLRRFGGVFALDTPVLRRHRVLEPSTGANLREGSGQWDSTRLSFQPERGRLPVYCELASLSWRRLRGRAAPSSRAHAQLLTAPHLFHHLPAPIPPLPPPCRLHISE